MSSPFSLREGIRAQQMVVFVNRCRMHAAIAGIGAVLLFVGAACAPSASADASLRSGEPPSQVLKTALASATTEGSVHITVHFFSGKTTGVLVEDSARTSAKQTVAIGKERVSIILTHGTAYFAGNSSGLTRYFGMTASNASVLSGRWIAVLPSDAGFKDVTAGLTLRSALKEASPSGSVMQGKRRTLHRQPTLSISGTGSANGPQTTLFVATSGKPLPVEAVSSSRSGETASGEIITFSRWGESVQTPTPVGAIPVSAIPPGSVAPA
jgi:hypothetical protein